MSYITDTSTPASKVIHLDSAHAHVRYLKDEEWTHQASNPFAQVVQTRLDRTRLRYHVWNTVSTSDVCDRLGCW